jgi:hypothetical protein
MKTFVHTLIIMATLVLGSVALADEKAHVITGRVVDVSSVSIDVQSGKKRLEINTQGIKDVVPKVGDTVTVHYTSGNHIYRADPDNIATKIEVKAPGGSKQ